DLATRTVAQETHAVPTAPRRAPVRGERDERLVDDVGVQRTPPSQGPLDPGADRGAPGQALVAPADLGVVGEQVERLRDVADLHRVGEVALDVLDVPDRLDPFDGVRQRPAPGHGVGGGPSSGRASEGSSLLRRAHRRWWLRSRASNAASYSTMSTRRAMRHSPFRRSNRST